MRSTPESPSRKTAKSVRLLAASVRSRSRICSFLPGQGWRGWYVVSSTPPSCGVHFHCGALCERGFRYEVNAAFACRLCRYAFQIHDVSAPVPEKPVWIPLAWRAGSPSSVATPQPKQWSASAPSPTKSRCKPDHQHLRESHRREWKRFRLCAGQNADIQARGRRFLDSILICAVDCRPTH